LTLITNQEEEARKIQFSGRSSYMIALPKRWVDEIGLKAGDQVLVIRQTNSSLLIVPKGLAPLKSKGEVTVYVSPADSAGSLVRKLVSLYLIAYSLIHVKSTEGKLTSTQRDTVKEAVRRNFVGTEVIADSIDGITIQVLLGFPELSVENALRRMFLITASMHRDAVRALGELDQDAAQGVMKTDDEVDRFSLYAIRQLKVAVENDRVLREMGLTTPRDCLGYRLIVKSVERVADHATKIAQGVLSLKRPLHKTPLEKIRGLSDLALSLFEESGRSLFKRDYDAADRVVEQAKLIGATQDDLLKALAGSERLESYHTLRLIIEDIRRTAEYASDIAEIVLNLTAEQTVAKP